MENQKLNLQTVVAVVFIFILVAATVTTVFGQDQNNGKKERTKVVQLKIVEDENGNVKSIDTTFVADENQYFDFDNFYNIRVNPFGDSLNVMLDFDSDNFSFMDMDSLLKEITVNVESMDDGKMMMFITSEMEDAMEDMDKQMHAFTYSFQNGTSNVDSLIEVTLKQLNCAQDSLVKTKFKHLQINSDSAKITVFSDGKELKIDEDGEVKVIKLGKGKQGMVWTGDTIIEDGDRKIIIKSAKNDDDLEQTIEYIISDENSDDMGNQNTEMKVMTVNGAKTIWVDENGEVRELDGENYEFFSDDPDSAKNVKVMVIKKDGNKRVWINDENEIYALDGAKYEFQPASKNDLEDLKDAGVKTKKKELQLENLKFSPNPNNGKFNLSFTLAEKKKVTINIYDLNGNVVYTETLKDFQGEYNKEIDLSKQESGTFFLQIVQGLYDIIKKIIIQ